MYTMLDRLKGWFYSKGIKFWITVDILLWASVILLGMYIALS